MGKGDSRLFFALVSRKGAVAILGKVDVLCQIESI